MRITLANARHFKRCCDCLRDVVADLTFEVSPMQLVAYALDDGVQVRATIPKGRCVEYDVPHTVRFGAATDTIARLLRTAQTQQRVRLVLQDTVLRFELFSQRSASRFSMQTLDAPQPLLPVDAPEPPLATCQVRVDHLRTLLRDLRHVGEKIAAELQDGALILYGKSDSTDGEVVTSELERCEGDGCFGVYPLGPLQHFLKAQHIAPLVTLEFVTQGLHVTLFGDITLTLKLHELGGAL